MSQKEKNNGSEVTAWPLLERVAAGLHTGAWPLVSGLVAGRWPLLRSFLHVSFSQPLIVVPFPLALSVLI